MFWKSYRMLQKLKFRGDFPDDPWALEFTLVPALSTASDQLNPYFVVNANYDDVSIKASDITSNPLIQQYFADYSFFISEHGFEYDGIWIQKKVRKPSAQLYILQNATHNHYDGSERVSPTYEQPFHVESKHFVRNSITLLFSGHHVENAHAVYKVSVIPIDEEPDDEELDDEELDDEEPDDEEPDDEELDDGLDDEEPNDEELDEELDDEELDDEELADKQPDVPVDDVPDAPVDDVPGPSKPPGSGWQVKKRNREHTFKRCTKNHGWCSKEQGHKYRCNSALKPRFIESEDDDWLNE